MDSGLNQMFFELHRGLPRQAPGDRASTLAALEHARDGAEGRLDRVLDVGCGPGAQTIDLAEALPQANLLAADLHEEYLRELAARAAERGVSERIVAVRADMRRLPAAAASFDLIWCEGAAYIMGVAEALDAWWHLLRSGGACAFTDAVWLAPDPPAELATFWNAYPGMRDVEGCRTLLRRRGYRLAADFVLPPEAWWEGYYQPLEARIARFEARHRDDAAAAAVAESRREIEIWQRYRAWYGYAFFIARKP